MTNTIALWLGGLIIAVFALDAFVLEWELPVLIMRELAHLIEWLAIWR